MNEPTERNSDGNGNMDEVGQVIKLVGARESVPDERFVRSRQKVHQHWQQVVAEQRVERRPRRFGVIAIAASFAVVAVTAFVLWNLSYVPPVNSLASIERVLGEVRIAGDVASKGTVIAADTLIATDHDSRIALRMSGGQALRIDTDSHVIVHSPSHISLEAGALYIDTAATPEESPILVSTPLGTAQDIGTQFQVRVTGMMLVVGVRQGMVEVSQPGQQSLSIDKGQYVELDVTGESGKHPLQPDDPDWDWIETVAPEFDIQDATLEQYLEWYAGENGLKLVWADEASEAKAKAALLTGSISGANRDESLMIVKQIAPFEHRISNDSLWVEVE